MVDCRKCQRFSACYFDNDDCIGFVPKTMTNADRIRAMTDEELAEFINMVWGNGRAALHPHNGWHDWLKEEVTDV